MTGAAAGPRWAYLGAASGRPGALCSRPGGFLPPPMLSSVLRPPGPQVHGDRKAGAARAAVGSPQAPTALPLELFLTPGHLPGLGPPLGQSPGVLTACSGVIPEVLEAC